jgi:type IX secretion system PorP/SprF family membrane protein
MRKTLILLLLSSSPLWAQFGLADDYPFNLLAINPAFAGERGNFGVTALLGNQFVGSFTPRQVSQIVSLEGKIGTGNSSIGFQGYRNSLGNGTNSGLNLSYAYALNLAPLRISFGINGGFGVSPPVFGNTDFTNQIAPFAGLGVMAAFKDGFLSISAPTLLSKTNLFIPTRKPINLMIGYRIGSSESIALNINALTGFERNPNESNFYHINPKIWIADKVGIGTSIRFQQNKDSNFIPLIQYRVSESSSVGLSYDPNPFSQLQIQPQFSKQAGVIQVIYKYDVFDEGEKTPFLNLF